MAIKKALPKKVAPAKTVVAKAKTTPPPSPADKRTTIQQQLAELAAQMAALDAEAVNELKAKISDTKKVLRGYELELEQLTGKSTASSKTRRERRPSITDETLKDQIIKVMSSDGKEGMNAKQLADLVQQNPIRIRKFIADNPKALKRTGSGPGTKLFLS